MLLQEIMAKKDTAAHIREDGEFNTTVLFIFEIKFKIYMSLSMTTMVIGSHGYFSLDLISLLGFDVNYTWINLRLWASCVYESFHVMTINLDNVQSLCQVFWTCGGYYLICEQR